MYDELNGLN